MEEIKNCLENIELQTSEERLGNWEKKQNTK